MAKKASLPFKGSFTHSQGFGDRPEIYKQFGLAGHDGDDWLMPVGTPLYAPGNGVVLRVGEDPAGYGNYIYFNIPHENLIINIAHMSRIVVSKYQRLNGGDLIGYSGNSGFSEAPHVHVAASNTFDNINRATPADPFRGWRSILDSSQIELVPLDSWRSLPEYKAPSGGTIPAPSGGTPTIPSVNPFDVIFQKYYQGWNRTAAEQDYKKAYGSDENRLKIARGIVDEGKKKVSKKRPAILNKSYTLNPHWGGLTLQQIASSGIELGRVDLLSGFLGIPSDQKLQSGQLISLLGFPTDYYPDSSEWLGVQKLTQKGTIGNKGEYYIKPEYAGMSLHDIRDKTNLPFRSDILGKFLGIGDHVPILADEGLGTQGFPNIYDTGSGEVQSFFQLFTKTPPAPVPGIPAVSPGEVEGMEPQAPSVQEATISVRSTPNKAKFYIDGLYFKDLTPSNKPYPVAAGQHTVRIEKEGYQSWEQVFQLSEGEQKQINVTLTKGEKAAMPSVPESALGTAIAVEALAVRISKIEQILAEKGLL